MNICQSTLIFFSVSLGQKKKEEEPNTAQNFQDSQGKFEDSEINWKFKRIKIKWKLVQS